MIKLLYIRFNNKKFLKSSIEDMMTHPVKARYLTTRDLWKDGYFEDAQIHYFQKWPTHGAWSILRRRRHPLSPSAAIFVFHGPTQQSMSIRLFFWDPLFWRSLGLFRHLGRTAELKPVTSKN
jgi:hypothetical protein